MERTPERKKDWLEHMQGKAIDDIITELEADGFMVSEQDIIEEHEYQAHELDIEEAMVDEMAESDMN